MEVRQLAAITAALTVEAEAHWFRPEPARREPKAAPKKPKNRDKVKAARKQKRKNR